MLDFVPNHVAVDHPWALEQPELLVTCAVGEGSEPPQGVEIGGVLIANGAERAASSGAWGDTLQLDYSKAATSAAMSTIVAGIAHRGLADALRCDMAHLALSATFESGWGHIKRTSPSDKTTGGAGQNEPPLTGVPPREFWSAAIAAAQSVDPGFVFLAESYGAGSAWALQQLGFHFTYDDSFYHKSRGASAVPLAAQGGAYTVQAAAAAPGQCVWPLAARSGMQPQGNSKALAEHMSGSAVFHTRCCRYIENHDEPRAAAAYALPVPAVAACAKSDDSTWRDACAAALASEQARHFAAAVLLMFSPGARLLHDGQLSGRRQHHSMHIEARPSEGAAPWCVADGLNASQEAEVAWPHHGISAFYSRLLALGSCGAANDGLWAPVPVRMTADKQDSPLIALARVPCTASAADVQISGACVIVVVNMSYQAASGVLDLGAVGTGSEGGSEEAVVGGALSQLERAPKGVLTFEDAWSGKYYRRSAGSIFSAEGGGLSAHLPAWGFHVFRLTTPSMGHAGALTCAAAPTGLSQAWQGVLLAVADTSPPAAAWRL